MSLPKEFVEKQEVMVQWDDGCWYASVVDKKKSGRYFQVKFGDGKELVVPKDKIINGSKKESPTATPTKNGAVLVRLPGERVYRHKGTVVREHDTVYDIVYLSDHERDGNVPASRLFDKAEFIVEYHKNNNTFPVNESRDTVWLSWLEANPPTHRPAGRATRQASAQAREKLLADREPIETERERRGRTRERKGRKEEDEGVGGGERVDGGVGGEEEGKEAGKEVGEEGGKEVGQVLGKEMRGRRSRSGSARQRGTKRKAEEEASVEHKPSRRSRSEGANSRRRTRSQSDSTPAPVEPIEPVEHQSNHAPDPVEHQSNRAPDPVEHQSNPAPDPVEHQSNPAPDPVEHQSNHAPDPVEHQSNPAPEPVAQSNSRKRRRKTNETPANGVEQQPIKIEAGAVIANGRSSSGSGRGRKKKRGAEEGRGGANEVPEGAIFATMGGRVLKNRPKYAEPDSDDEFIDVGLEGGSGLGTDVVAQVGVNGGEVGVDKGVGGKGKGKAQEAGVERKRGRGRPPAKVEPQVQKVQGVQNTAKTATGSGSNSETILGGKKGRVIKSCKHTWRKGHSVEMKEFAAPTNNSEYLAFRGCSLPVILAPNAVRKRESGKVQQKGILQKTICLLSKSIVNSHMECKWCRFKLQYLCGFENLRLYWEQPGRQPGTKQIEAIGFLTEDHQHEDTRMWTEGAANVELNIDTARELLRLIGRPVLDLLNEELGMENEFRVLCDAQPKSQVYWKKPKSVLAREECDMCRTSLFNRHFACRRCCHSVCLDCMREAAEKIAQAGPDHIFSQAEYQHTLLGKCSFSSNEKSIVSRSRLNPSSLPNPSRHYEHLPKDYMLLGSIPTSVLKDMRSKIEEFLDSEPRPRPSEQVEYSYRWGDGLADTRVLYLPNPNHADNTKRMRARLAVGLPVVIAGVHTNFKSDWSPKAFMKKFPDQMVTLVDCNQAHQTHTMPSRVFWASLSDRELRPKDREGQPVSLKLKDWPPGKHFKDALPEQYDDFMQALPFKEYTTPNGSINIVRHLPGLLVPPDMGPKMYTANGQAVDRGTTNLHVDMSDAINIMAHVGPLSQDQECGLEMEPEREDVARDWDPYELRPMPPHNVELQVGAAWHIWQPKDAKTIRDYLEKKRERMEAGDDTIHDQVNYITAEDRQVLLDRHNVKSFFIQQRLGEAVVIPAGAPHQVRNYVSCIKIAEDFVSPENIDKCLQVTQQFRKLSKAHANKADKLQIRSIVFHTAKDALRVLDQA